MNKSRDKSWGRCLGLLFLSALLPICALGCGKWNTATQLSPPELSTSQSDPETKAAQASEEVRIPNLHGNSEEFARQRLHLRRLNGVHGRLFVPPDKWRSQWCEGHVYLQTPRQGSRSASGATVAFWSYHPADPGRAVVETPYVIGLTEDQARNALREAGLEVMVVVRQPSVGDPVRQSETVVDQYPRGGRSILVGSTVLLQVVKQSK